MDIKCAACGHIETHGYDDKGEFVEEGPEFISIDGSFTVTEGYLTRIIQKVSLYACPICGTVKMIKD